MSARKPPPFFIELINAMDGAGLSSNARNVLMAQFKFGTHANGRNSRVSEGRLVTYTGLSVRTVQRARQELREGKWLIERERGHNGKDHDAASLYDINIPPATVAVPKPKRAPNNPNGFNARKKELPVTGDGKLPAKSSTNPSKLPVTGDHLSWEPLRDTNKSDVKQSHLNDDVVPGKPNTASADAEREDVWVTVGPVVGSKEGHPQSTDSVDRSNVNINSGDALPGRPVVGPLHSSACGGELIEDISKGDGICCLCDCAIINQPFLDYGGVPAHHRCVYAVNERERWACPHCPSGYFATAEELNAHVRVHHQPAPFEAAAPW